MLKFYNNLFDTHAHWNHDRLDGNTYDGGKMPYISPSEDDEENFVRLEGVTREELIQKTIDSGVTHCVVPAIDLDSNESVLKFCSEFCPDHFPDYPGYAHASIGNHPSHCYKFDFSERGRLDEYAKVGMQKGVLVAVGETGLDYHLEENVENIDKQIEWFEYQIDLADRLKLPLILHIRGVEKEEQEISQHLSVYDDAIAILRKNKDKLRNGGIVHCFYEGPEIAHIMTEEFGLFLGVGGTLLSESGRKDKLEESIKSISLDKLVLETDLPYVMPTRPEDMVSKKGWKKTRNNSLILHALCRRIAALNGVITPEKIAEITTENAIKVYRLYDI